MVSDEDQVVWHESEAIFGIVQRGSVHVKLQLESGERMGDMAYRDVFFVPPGCRCEIRNNNKRSSTVARLRFEVCEPRNEASHDFCPPFSQKPDLCRKRMPHIQKWIQSLMDADAIIASQTQEASLARYYTQQSYLYAIAAEFVAGVRQEGSADRSIIDYVIELKHQLLTKSDEVIDVEQLAQESGVSYVKFYQEFKRYTGMSPLQYITTSRLNESLQLLANEPSSIAEVAHAAGYEDELYFSRLFRKYIGVSPSEYARLARTRVACLSPVFRGDLTVLGLTPVLELPRAWFDAEDKESYMMLVEQCAPDMIFTSPVADDLYDRLCQLCPVRMIRWKGYPWKERLLEIGHVLGLPMVAQRWIEIFQTKAANARELVARKIGDQPFLVVSAYGDRYRVYGMQRRKIRDLFYDELGLRPPESVMELGFLDTNSLEEVARLNCDHVLFLTPESMTDMRRDEMESEWFQLWRDRYSCRCLFLEHEDPLLYNADFYGKVVDQFVHDLLTRYD